MKIAVVLLGTAVALAALPHPALAQAKGKAFGTCVKDGKGYVPASLDDAMRELEKLLDKSQLTTMKKEDPIRFHHGLGTSLRNCWGLWSGGSALGRWFNKQGIQHPDDMSSIVLTSFHRRLNGKPLEVDKQIKQHQDYWKARQKDYETGKSSEGSVFDLVPFVKGEGWVSIKGKMIPRINDLVLPIKAHAQRALTDCWKRLPKTPGNSAVDTELAITISKAGKISAAKVVKSAIPADHAACFAKSLIGTPTPKHAGASYTVTLASYRMVAGESAR